MLSVKLIVLVLLFIIYLLFFNEYFRIKIDYRLYYNYIDFYSVIIGILRL